MAENTKAQDVIKDTLVNTAEHPMKYRMQAVKNFGKDAMNNTSIKSAFQTMKQQMKFINDARQECIDNEYIYRTYKQQALSALKTTGKAIATPIKSATTSVITSVFGKAKDLYNKSCKAISEFAAKLDTAPKAYYKFKEAISLGAYSRYNKGQDIQNQIGKLSRRYNKIPKIVKKVCPELKYYYEARVKNLIASYQYVQNQMKEDVWGKNKLSPEDHFQNVIANASRKINNAKTNVTNTIDNVKTGVSNAYTSAKTTVGNAITNTGKAIKKVPSQVVNFFKSVGRAATNVVKSAGIGLWNNVLVPTQNAIQDFRINQIVKKAKDVKSISDYVSTKQVSLAKAAKTAQEEVVARTKTVKDINNQLMGVKNGTIVSAQYESEATKSIKEQLASIDQLHNPQAAALLKLQLDAQIAKDKKEFVKDAKLKIASESVKNVGSVTKSTSTTLASKFMDKLEKTSKDMETSLIRSGKEIQSNKWKKVVTDVSKASAEQIKDMVDRGKNVDFTKVQPDVLKALNSKFGMEFSINNGKIELSNPFDKGQDAPIQE